MHSSPCFLWRGLIKMNHSLKAAAVLLLVILQIPLPAFAQQAAASAPSPAQAPQTNPPQPQAQAPAPSAAQAPVPPPQAAPPSPPRTLNLAPDYSYGKRWFPSVAAPYTPYQVPSLSLSNSPRLNDLIQNGKLMLTLEDAISLGLENNMDIAVQRYTPWLDEVHCSAPLSGVNGRLVFDPVLTGTGLYRASLSAGEQSVSRGRGGRRGANDSAVPVAPEPDQPQRRRRISTTRRDSRPARSFRSLSTTRARPSISPAIFSIPTCNLR